MFKLKVIPFFILLFSVPFLIHPAANAQVVSSDTLQADLDEIQIDATYSPITIGRASMSLSYVLRDRDDIAARQAATMDELTFSIPGVSISNRENYALGERMTIRGLGWRSQFGVRGVQVLLDDLPLTVADGQTIMNMIDPAMVNRIEVLRGPSATFWGNSSGGVMYLSTIPNVDDPTIQYRGYAGSNNTVKQELRFNDRIGSSRIYGYATYFDTDGFRNHSAARLFRASLGSQHQLTDNSRLKLIANYTGMPKAQHPGALTAEQSVESPQMARGNFEGASAGKSFDQAMGGASYIREFETGILDITAHGTYRDLKNPLPFGHIGVERYAGGTRATYSFQHLPFDFDAGAEIKIQRDDRFETANIDGEPSSDPDDIDLQQLETVTNQALFSRITIPLTDRLSANLGVRADRITFEAEDNLGSELDGSRDFFSINPNAGLSFRTGPAQLFANFSTSFESPTTTELGNRPEGGSGFNQNIEPERTIGFETGFRGQTLSNQFQYDITLYTMQVRDRLLPFEIDEGGQTFFRNEGETNHQGLEASFQFLPTEWFDVRVMANILNATFSDGEFDGNDLPGVPTSRLSYMFTFRPGSHIFTIDNQWVDAYAANSDNSSYTDDYFLTNMRWTTRPFSLSEQSSIRPFVSVNNLFDTRYNTSVNIDAFGGFLFEPGSDRSFQAGIQINFD